MEIQNTEMFENFDNYMSDDDFYTYSSSIPIFEESEGESDEDYEEQEDRTDELSDNENFDDIHETEKKAPKKELTPCIIVTNIEGRYSVVQNMPIIREGFGILPVSGKWIKVPPKK